jgi:hypothetical protein
VDASDFDARAAVDRLRRLLGVETLAAFGCDEWPEALASAQAILLQADRAHLRLDPGTIRLHAEHPQAYMHLDPPTRRSLGLSAGLSREDDLLGLFEGQTITPMGSRCLRRWLDRPLRDLAELDARLDRVQLLAGDPLGRARLRTALRPVHDLERLVARSSRGLATPRDVSALARTLQVLPAVRSATEPWSGPWSMSRQLTFARVGSLSRASMRSSTGSGKDHAPPAIGSAPSSRPNASGPASVRCGSGSTRFSATTSRSRTRTASWCHPNTCESRRS